MVESPFSVHDILVSTVFFLAATCIAVPFFKRIGLGSVLGYLTAGIIVGPFGFKLYTDTKSIMHFAEIGVVFLLFVIGLELNLTKLWSMRRDVFGLGSLQVLITGLALGVCLYALPIIAPLSFSISIVIGATLALSSTAFAIQLMKERNELQTPHGQSAFSVLLFQDLAAIPLIALVPLMAASAGLKEMGSNLVPISQAIAVILGVVFFGRILFGYLLRLIAQAKAKDVFTAASLLLVIGVSLLMESVGLSMALGAFLSGVILADSEYRHELEADIEPFKGLLLGLFFMAVGMNINLSTFLERPFTIFGITFFLVGIKFSTLYLLSRSMKMNRTSSKMVGLLLCQGGEFGFVIFGLAEASQLLDIKTVELLTLIITFSMVLTPLALFIFEKIRRVEGTDKDKSYNTEFDIYDPKVIIAGYGRFGQIAARILTMQKVPFTTLEHSPENVQTALKFGFKIHYGDATRLDLLHVAGVDKAKAFLIAIDDVEVSIHLAQILRSHFPHLKIFARARNRQHVFDLRKAGVQVIRRELLASSLDMSENLLNELGVSASRAKEIVTRFKNHDEVLLDAQYNLRADEKLMINKTREMNAQLEQLLQEDLESIS